MNKFYLPRPRIWLVLAASGLALAGGVAAQESATSRYPITTDQRRVADEVAQAGVPLSALAPNAPDTYTVKRGDTLWDISKVFLTSPWRWPELWGMNKEQIKNPHLIYPNQMLVLVKGAERAYLKVADGTTPAALPGAPGDVVRLSPHVRDAATEGGAAISSIPNNLIEPFLSQPVVYDAADMTRYPRIVGTQEGRLHLGRGDVAYVRGITNDKVENYHVFRPARALYDPDDVDHKKPIAYEAFYLGTARMAKPGEIATLRVQDSKQEMDVGDRLVPIERQALITYVPHRPDRPVDGRIVSIYEGVNQAGPRNIITLNRGRADGLEIGHVLALLDTGETVRDVTVPGKEYIKLPDERIGEIFVFRVFDHISYALIMMGSKPVKVGDRFIQPDDVEYGYMEPRPAVSAFPNAAPLSTTAPQTVSPGAADTYKTPSK
ncbi:MAG TPA: LysM peptidoglycan-binding domain-containing protein [Burkholderiaceae bacterium]|nr:LysM peptidoglycan-binding domain-containing protein [Burkholderiaceae bacterium]